jgi:DNA-binding NarL/FixJ family response regulator
MGKKTKMKRLAIGILDPHKFVHDCVREICSSSNQYLNLVSTNTSIPALQNDLKKIQLSVLIIDVNLPLEYGIDLCKSLRKNYINMKIIVFSSYEKIDIIAEVLKTGIQSYIKKNESLSELKHAIYEVIAKGFYFCYDLSEFFVNERPKSIINFLTNREQEIVELIRKELTTKAIANKLEVHIKTIEMHRSRILEKTDSKKMTGAIDYLLSNGIIKPNSK